MTGKEIQGVIAQLDAAAVPQQDRMVAIACDHVEGGIAWIELDAAMLNLTHSCYRAWAEQVQRHAGSNP